MEHGVPEGVVDPAKGVRGVWAPGVRGPGFQWSLNDQRAVHVESLFSTNVLDPSFPLSSEVIIAQAVMGWIDDRLQLSSEHHPLGRIHFALENGILHALSEVLTDLGNFSEPP